MRKKIKYTDEPIGAVTVISDFLPSPEDLVLREETVKVTLALSRRSLDFFRAQAKKTHAPYQKMIRALLDQYASRFA